MDQQPGKPFVDIQHVEAIVRRVFSSPPLAIERVAEGVSTYVYRIIFERETFYLRVLPEEGASFALARSLQKRPPNWYTQYLLKILRRELEILKREICNH